MIEQQKFERLKVFFKPSAEFNRCLPFPREIMVRIFQKMVSSSENPISELVKLCRVCEAWRQIVLHEPSLWNRLDLFEIPLSRRNASTLKRIYSDEFAGNDSIEEFTISGSMLNPDKRNITALSFMRQALSSPRLRKLEISYAIPIYSNKFNKLFKACIKRSKSLEAITISYSKELLGNQKWLANFLSMNGAQIRYLDISASYDLMSSKLLENIYHYCPNLITLDLTCHHYKGYNVDATRLASALEKLEILRLDNVRFRRVIWSPDKYGLKNLREISIAIMDHDPNRDDPLLATLTYGSTNLKVINVFGSNITVNAMLNMPSDRVEELHMNIQPMILQEYSLIFKKWSKSLTRISLVMIRCTKTIRSCLRALINDDGISIIREIDLSFSNIDKLDLRDFLRATRYLESIDLSLCTLYPNQSFICYGLYKINPGDEKDLEALMQELNLN